MRAVPLLPLLLHLAWSTALPVLHAQGEVLSAQVAVEGTHTAGCARLHDPAHGSTCVMAVAVPTSAPRHALALLVAGPALPAGLSDLAPADAGLFALHHPRSPPFIP